MECKSEPVTLWTLGNLPREATGCSGMTSGPLPADLGGCPEVPPNCYCRGHLTASRCLVWDEQPDAHSERDPTVVTHTAVPSEEIQALWSMRSHNRPPPPKKKPMHAVNMQKPSERRGCFPPDRRTHPRGKPSKCVRASCKKTNFRVQERNLTGGIYI